MPTRHRRAHRIWRRRRTLRAGVLPHLARSSSVYSIMKTRLSTKRSSRRKHRHRPSLPAPVRLYPICGHVPSRGTSAPPCPQTPPPSRGAGRPERDAGTFLPRTEEVSEERPLPGRARSRQPRSHRYRAVYRKPRALHRRSQTPRRLAWSRRQPLFAHRRQHAAVLRRMQWPR